MSLLGMEFDIKGYTYKPFYIILGVFFFSGLLIFLLMVYGYCYIKFTLIEWIKQVKKERNKWYNNK